MPVLSEPAGEKASFSMPEQKRRPVNPKLTNTTSIVERDLFAPERGARSVVPNVVGLAQADAEPAIRGAALTVDTVTTANSPTVAAGRVISQDPVGGSTVAEGSPVALVISLGPALVEVPDFVLLGTFIAGSQRYAIVEVPPEEGPRAGRGKRLLRGKRLTRGEQRRLALGDTLDGFKLVKIHSQRVVFKRGSSTLEVVLDFSHKVEEVKEKMKVPKKARQVAKARTPRRPERSLEVEDEED